MKTPTKFNKTYLRAGIRCVCFVTFLLIYAVYDYSSTSTNFEEDWDPHRQLQETPSGNITESGEDSSACDDISKADPAWFCVWYLLGVFYVSKKLC